MEQLLVFISFVLGTCAGFGVFCWYMRLPLCYCGQRGEHLGHCPECGKEIHLGNLEVKTKRV